MKKIKSVINAIWRFLKGEHKHLFTKKVVNDMGNKILTVCEICGCQDGDKFWAELNELYYQEYPEQRPITYKN